MLIYQRVIIIDNVSISNTNMLSHVVTLRWLIKVRRGYPQIAIFIRKHDDNPFEPGPNFQTNPHRHSQREEAVILTTLNAAIERIKIEHHGSTGDCNDDVGIYLQ